MFYALPRPRVDFLTGNEHFKFKGKSIGVKVKDFWQWFASDLINNAIRGILAEYLVGVAIKAQDITYPREPWAAYDLFLRDGTKIEVKTGAYIQSWAQEKLSNIVFTIKPTHEWSSKTNKLSKRIKRQADIYIFCVFIYKNKKDPKLMQKLLELNNWDFYIAKTKDINKWFGKQKTVSLGRLQQHLEPVKWGEIRKVVKRVKGR